MRLREEAEYLTCDYCGSIQIPDPNPDGVRVLGVPAEESCPVCEVKLTHATVAGHRIRYCQKCHGMLIVMDLFRLIVQDLRARRESSVADPHRPDARDLDRRIHCPQCRGQMDAHPYMGPGNVIIDSCESCGLAWLDYGELDRIVRAPDWTYAAE